MPYLPPARVADVSVAAVFTASPALVAVPWFAIATAAAALPTVTNLKFTDLLFGIAHFACAAANGAPL